MTKPELTTADRLSLYRSTIFFQWLIVAFVAWRCIARAVDPAELGLVVTDIRRVLWTTIVLTAILCANQVVGLRRIASLPEGKRRPYFAITEKIMPRSLPETLVFAALACTAGLSEEFLYRGFVFMAFTRMMVHYGPSLVAAAIFSSIWFSVAHLYQGWRGSITTFVVGMIFSSIRIWTASLVPVIFAHIAIDLIAGILLPKFLWKA
ncbi:MAG TPA: CPBP family intramembrane glutamic endopeptidase [Candidatus Acidoferrales bacterium]